MTRGCDMWAWIWGVIYGEQVELERTGESIDLDASSSNNGLSCAVVLDVKINKFARLVDDVHQTVD